jgi:hypothetical protein
MFLFPRWTNRAFTIGLGALASTSLLAAAAWAYYGNDANLAVGYGPVQPVDFDHKLHAGDLGVDCRYCHFTVERAPFAAVPATQICMNCHSKVRTDSAKLVAIRESAAQDQPIAWLRVHKLADYVYFDHATHLSAGVGCSTCHGRVDQMPRVEQVEPLSMGFCVDCHRSPQPHLRAPSEVTQMDWQPPRDRQPQRSVDPPVHCSGCHR